jgi:hypothetical protein
MNMVHEFKDVENNITAIATEMASGWTVRLRDDDAVLFLPSVLFCDDETTAVATAKNWVGLGTIPPGWVTV